MSGRRSQPQPAASDRTAPLCLRACAALRPCTVVRLPLKLESPRWHVDQVSQSVLDDAGSSSLLQTELAQRPRRDVWLASRHTDRDREKKIITPMRCHDTSTVARFVVVMLAPTCSVWFLTSRLPP